MNVYLMAFVALLGYLIVALGVMRSVSPTRYTALRTPRNGVQMPVDDARREARKLAAQEGFAWPVFLVAFSILIPLVVLFDGLPWAGRKVAEGAGALAPALAPITGWVNKPLALEVKREEALALTARADEPVADEPLVPDEIARWTAPEPVKRKRRVDGLDLTWDEDDIVMIRRATDRARAERKRGYLR